MAKAKAKKSAGKVSPVNISKGYAEIVEIVKNMEDDTRKFTEQTVAASGKRLRANAQAIKQLCAQLRKDIMLVINAKKGK